METYIAFILLGLIVFGVLFSCFVRRAIKTGSVPHGDGQKILDPKGLDDGLALVVFDDKLNGKLAACAQYIAQEFYHNGYKVVLDRPSLDLSANVAEYDVVVFGSAVKFGQFSEALLDYIAGLQNLNGKTVGLFTASSDQKQVDFTATKQSLKVASRVIEAQFKLGSDILPKKQIRDFVQATIQEVDN